MGRFIKLLAVSVDDTEKSLVKQLCTHLHCKNLENQDTAVFCNLTKFNTHACAFF